MATKEISITVKRLDDSSDILAKIQVERDGELKSRSNVLSATFELEAGLEYEFSVEVKGTPGKKFEVLVSGAKKALYRKGPLDIPENGKDVVAGDIVA